jgi:Arc/MetJ-type ribon-helix-helix transcriptional regulator
LPFNFVSSSSVIKISYLLLKGSENDIDDYKRNLRVIAGEPAATLPERSGL